MNPDGKSDRGAPGDRAIWAEPGHNGWAAGIGSEPIDSSGKSDAKDGPWDFWKLLATILNFAWIAAFLSALVACQFSVRSWFTGGPAGFLSAFIAMLVGTEVVVAILGLSILASYTAWSSARLWAAHNATRHGRRDREAVRAFQGEAADWTHGILFLAFFVFGTGSALLYRGDATWVFAASFVVTFASQSLMLCVLLRRYHERLAGAPNAIFYLSRNMVVPYVVCGSTALLLTAVLVYFCGYQEGRHLPMMVALDKDNAAAADYAALYAYLFPRAVSEVHIQAQVEGAAYAALALLVVAWLFPALLRRDLRKTASVALALAMPFLTEVSSDWAKEAGLNTLSGILAHCPKVVLGVAIAVVISELGETLVKRSEPREGCPLCRKDVGGEDNFCRHCGNPLPGTPTSDRARDTEDDKRPDAGLR
jgi:hypothetical protein